MFCRCFYPCPLHLSCSDFSLCALLTGFACRTLLPRFSCGCPLSGVFSLCFTARCFCLGIFSGCGNFPSFLLCFLTSFYCQFLSSGIGGSHSMTACPSPCRGYFRGSIFMGGFFRGFIHRIFHAFSRMGKPSGSLFCLPCGSPHQFLGHSGRGASFLRLFLALCPDIFYIPYLPSIFNAPNHIFSYLPAPAFSDTV